MFWSCKGFESHIAKGFRMSKAELSFLDSMEHRRLEIHWFRIATTQMVSPEVVSFQLHTAFQLCAENDLGAWNSSSFPRSNHEMFLLYWQGPVWSLETYKDSRRDPGSWMADPKGLSWIDVWLNKQKPLNPDRGLSPNECTSFRLEK